MRFLLLALLCMMVPNVTTFAQPDILWTRTFGGAGWDNAHDAQVAEDGGFIVIGGTNSFGEGGNDFWLLKTDSSGNQVWTNTFGGSESDNSRSVKQATDGGYVLVGDTESFGNGGTDIWLIKTDSDGEELWNHTFGGSGYDGSSSVEVTAEGGFLIAGATSSIGEGGSDLWLIKTDPEGNELWNRTFGGQENDDGFCATQTDDEGYIIVGKTESFGANSGDVWLIKTDSDGEEEWTRMYGGAGDDYGYDVRQVEDGGYIITGGTESFGAGSTDVWLIKTDASGDSVWSKTFGGTNTDYGIRVIQLEDGGYVLTGTTESFGAGSGDVWVIKTDSQGNEEWTRTIGGIDYDGSNSIQQTSDGGFFISGATMSFGEGSFDLWLIRLAAYENDVFDTSFENPTEFFLSNAYPNPFNSTTNISVKLPVSSRLNLRVYNIKGQEIAILGDQEYHAGTHQFAFSADGLASGLYFINAVIPGEMDDIREAYYIK